MSVRPICAALALGLSLLCACSAPAAPPASAASSASSAPAVSSKADIPSVLQDALAEADRCILPDVLPTGNLHMLDGPEVMDQLRAVLDPMNTQSLGKQKDFDPYLGLQLFSGDEELGKLQINAAGVVEFEQADTFKKEYWNFSPDAVDGLNGLLELQLQYETEWNDALRAALDGAGELSYSSAEHEDTAVCSDPDRLAGIKELLLCRDLELLDNGVWAIEWLERRSGDNWDEYYDPAAARTVTVPNGADSPFYLTLFSSYYPSGTPTLALTDENCKVLRTLHPLPEDAVQTLDGLFGVG